MSLPAGASPQGIAIDAATGTIYVANIGDNTISVINARTCNAVDLSGCGQAPASVKDPGGPIALAVDQATDTVYVANIGDNFSGKSHTVAVINGAICNGHQHSGCGQTPRTVRVGGGPDGVAVDQATDTVYAVNDGADNNNGAHRLGDQRGYLQRRAGIPAAGRPRPPVQSRARAVLDRRRPGHPHRLHRQQHRLDRLGDQHRHLQRPPAFRLWPATPPRSRLASAPGH